MTTFREEGEGEEEEALRTMHVTRIGMSWQVKTILEFYHAAGLTTIRAKELKYFH